MVKSQRTLGIIDEKGLEEATKGINYRYFQFRNSILVLPFSRCYLSDVYRNALVESFAINLRCLLEFFNIKEKPRLSGTYSSSVYIRHYFDPTLDKAEYQQISDAWNQYFIGSDPSKPIRFKCKDAFTGKDEEFLIQDRIDMLHSHVAHQGVWNIQEPDRKNGRISRKISDWHEEQFYPGIKELVKTWYKLLKEHKPELLHEKWNGIKDSDF